MLGRVAAAHRRGAEGGWTPVCGLSLHVGCDPGGLTTQRTVGVVSVFLKGIQEIRYTPDIIVQQSGCVVFVDIMAIN